jgi:phosphoenolpyruvate carboxykinase (ATP)
MADGYLKSRFDLSRHGLNHLAAERWNYNTPTLYEQIIRRREGVITHLGPIAVRTGTHTGRAARDKYIVREASSEPLVWWSDSNRPFSEELFQALYQRLRAYFQGKEVFIQDCYSGADPDYQLPIRIVTETAWHSLFARNLFIQTPPEKLADHIPQITVIHAPGFYADPETDGTQSGAFILIHLAKKWILIGGTAYAGEIKKAVFSMDNFLLPQEHVLTMHCSATQGKAGDVAIFFGLSGTGKTTLSADPNRRLIGDDEHGWSENGVFNFEGGCYAKTIRLSEADEPEIYQTTRRFGTILENVAYDPITRRLDLDDDSLTENTRAAYPLSHIPNHVPEKRGGHPTNILLLTSDAFGVLPPIARLTPEQAMYHFISGYTAKLGGTEAGMQKEPKATFSACFGAPFMVLHPTKYAELLKEKIQRHQANCWLVNTGWTQGPYGIGKRMSLPHTRALVNAALEGRLNEVEYDQHPIFRVSVPRTAPGVPAEILNPKNTWQDPDAYDRKARELAAEFAENFKSYASYVNEEIRAAGPVP